MQFTNPKDFKLRPKVAGPACEIHRLSNFLDIILKPYLKYVKSHVKDDIDILKYIPKNVSKGTILSSFDVKSLYSNIPHNFGLTAIKYWIDKYPETLPERISKEFIIQGMKFILENNFFLFNGKAYKQIKGTSMGTKVAPTYANLVMGYWETFLYKEVAKHFMEHHLYFIQNWKRYLDDCLILWPGTEEDMDKLKSIINNIHPDIQFTSESSQTELPFLDILIKKGNTGTTIETDIYYKPTDSKQYLLFNSCHPKHVRTNVPYNLARRICTIVSNEQTKLKRLNELKSWNNAYIQAD